jgi:hypothetical protein
MARRGACAGAGPAAAWTAASGAAVGWRERRQGWRRLQAGGWLQWLAAVAGCGGWLRWLAAVAGCSARLQPSPPPRPPPGASAHLQPHCPGCARRRHRPPLLRVVAAARVLVLVAVATSGAARPAAPGAAAAACRAGSGAPPLSSPRQPALSQRQQQPGCGGLEHRSKAGRHPPPSGLPAALAEPPPPPLGPAAAVAAPCTRGFSNPASAASASSASAAVAAGPTQIGSARRHLARQARRPPQARGSGRHWLSGGCSQGAGAKRAMPCSALAKHWQRSSRSLTVGAVPGRLAGGGRWGSPPPCCLAWPRGAALPGACRG